MAPENTLTLEIALLGPLQVRVDGRSAAFRTDAERALLAYLAAAAGASQRRDTLAALLSPDRPDIEALTYLRNRLARLREALRDEEAAPPWFAADRKQIALRTGADVLVDLARFAQHLAAVERHAHRELAGCPACLDQLYAAVALVRGELLAGLNFGSEPWQTWLSAQREHYQLRALEAMTLLRDALLARGEWAAALAIAQRQLILEPWLEPAHRAIMAAYAQLGDRNAALAQFAQCARRLADEFGVEAEAETQQLREQISAGGPVLASRAAAPGNLPLQSGPFFGREAEQAQLLQRLVDPAYRLISIVGAGGMGKTRLAVEVGEAAGASFPDGVWFVALDASSSGAEQIKIAVGEALGLAQSHKQLTGDQVLAVLRERRALLIFDNCEPVLEALAFLPEWLRRAPQLAILATSREPLGFHAESVLALDALPTGGEQPGAAEALFAERGRLARDDFALSAENLPLVRQICALVDGSPLGIGLAAAWVRRRSLRQIHAEIGRSLDFLSTRLRDVDPRHRSMRTVFEGSWQLLAPAEQAALAALAVFPSTFTAAAAAAVAGADLATLDALGEKSLLQQQPEPERYLLHGLLRQFAADRLAARAAEVERAFVDYFARFARQHGDDYSGLQPEWRNLSVAVATAHGLAAWSQVLDLVQALDEPWFRQMRLTDMRAGLVLALDAANALGDRPALARTLLRLGEVEMELNAYAAAEEHLAQATRQLNHLEDRLGMAQASFLLGRINLEQAHYAEALALFDEATQLFEAEATWPGVAKNLNLIALCHLTYTADLEAAQACLERSVALQRDLSRSTTYVEALRYLARVRGLGGDYAASERLLSEAAAISRNQQDLGEYAAVLFERTVLCRRQGQLEAGLRVGNECLASFQTLGSLRWEALTKAQLALLHQASGDLARAIRLFHDGLRIFEELGDRYEQGYACYHLFRAYNEAGQAEHSQRFRHQAIQINATLNDPQLQARLA